MSSPRPWRAFGVLALIEFLTVMDASIANIALPSIGDSLGFSPTMLAWVIDGYLIGLAGFLLIAGRATDLVGRRMLFLAGVVAFTGFSALCSVAVAPWQLVAGRVGQGLGAAMAMPSAIALITDLFPAGATRNKALGIFSGMAGVASPIGLVLGGALTAVSWRWIFLINIPIGLLAVVFGLRLLPSRHHREATRLDMVSALGLTGGLILLTMTVLRGGAQGWASMPTLIQAGSAVVLLGVFGIRQARGRNPLIPRTLLRSRTTVVGNTVFVFVGTILLGTFFITTLFLQRARDLDPLSAALVYLPVPAAMLTGTQLAPRLIRFGAANVLTGALALQATALAAWAVLITPDGNLLTAFAIPATVWALGLGAAIVCSFAICTSDTVPQLAGAASGLATTSYQGGGAIGLALLVILVDGHTDGTGPASLTTGFTAALWVSCAMAAAGAVITRLIPHREFTSRRKDREDLVTT